jgi:integrase
MPRLYHRPPKYCLHKGTKQATVSAHGERIYLGPYGSPESHAKYEAILKQWRTERDQLHEAAAPTQTGDKAAQVTPAILRDKRRGGSPLTVNELVLVYRRHAHQYYRKHGQVTREATITDDVIRFLRRHHAATVLEDFGPVALDDLRDRMITDLDWSRKHINKQVNRLVRMFTWAAEKELVDPSVPLALKSLAGLKKGRTRARESAGVSCVDDAVVDATLPHLPEVVADMVRVQRLTGARPGEVCTLRPCDLDRSSDVWLYHPSEHKTEHHEKNRVIVLGPQAQRVLMPYLLRPGQAFCFSPADSEQRRRAKAAADRKTPLSCGNHQGTNRVLWPRRKPTCRYTTDSYRRAIHRACKKHDIERWAPNRLRHTSATEIRKRYGIEAAQVVCGHESAEVTQIYAERNLELAKKVAREVG